MSHRSLSDGRSADLDQLCTELRSHHRQVFDALADGTITSGMTAVAALESVPCDDGVHRTYLHHLERSWDCLGDPHADALAHNRTIDAVQLWASLNNVDISVESLAPGALG